MALMKRSISTIATNSKQEDPKTRKGSQIETIRAAFANYDEDKSGAIDIRELQNLVEDLGGALHEDDLKKALKVLDKDQSGKIDQVQDNEQLFVQSVITCIIPCRMNL
jgi:Ca2+-binding EF-hand superfamily protein